MTGIATDSRYLADLADGNWVWCDWSQQEARTANGHCQYCGRTNHAPDAATAAHRADLVDAATQLVRELLDPATPAEHVHGKLAAYQDLVDDIAATGVNPDTARQLAPLQPEGRETR